MSSNEVPSITMPDALQQRADTLLAELRAYQTCLQSHKKQQDVEIRTFRKGIEAEVKALKTAMNSNLNSSVPGMTEFEIEELESKRIHALRSSNLPFYESVWRIAQNCNAVVALQRRVFCHVKSIPPKRSSGRVDGDVAKKPRTEKQTGIVDIIAQDGLEWIKVSTVTEKRLLFEMAEKGWAAYGDYSDSEDFDSIDEQSSMDKMKDEENQLELVKLAKVLYAASRQDRARFRRPRVRFIFTKIREGAYDDIDAVMADIRAIGIQVTCDGSDHEPDIANLSLDEVTHDQQRQQRQLQLTHLIPSASLLSHPPTPILNIDCTVLLALISDISHIPTSDLPPFPDNVSKAYHKTISRQISSEHDYPLLPHELYPYLADHRLVCTHHAAQRMREIVQTMGTQTERARADVLLGEGSQHGLSHGDLCAAMQGFSCHRVPLELQLPMQIVDFDFDFVAHPENQVARSTPDVNPSVSDTDHRIMHKVSEKMTLSSINSSVFMYGWRQGVVTVTSNRVVASGIMKCINEVLDEEEGEAEVEAEAGRETGAGVKAQTRIEVPSEKAYENKFEDFHFQGPKIYVCETARSLIGKEKQTKITRV